VDGNYSRVRDLVWKKADTIIWLDYSLPVILIRLTRRSIRRMITRQLLWQGNRENFRQVFLSRDSILLWALKTYRRRRCDYGNLFHAPEYSHLIKIHLKSPGDTNRWLEHITSLARD
jgi:hypothetical protein